MQAAHINGRTVAHHHSPGPGGGGDTKCDRQWGKKEREREGEKKELTVKRFNYLETFVMV